MSTSHRPLTPGEIAALGPGLAEALERAGAAPRITARPCVLARIAALWRGSVPIMVIGRTIYWPAAPGDLSSPGRERQMSVLQHELQHVLEFATGELGLLRYALWPANWRYSYRLTADTRWRDLGAEQRAQVVQDYWLAGRGLLKDAPALETFRRLIPWAV